MLVDNRIWAEVKGKLINEPFRMKAVGTALREGICPQCGKKSLWTKHAEQPGRVWCDRENKCGYTSTAKELFPELFDAKRVIKDNPPTAENPNATADAWMRQIRGFDVALIKGRYSQHRYEYHPREAKESRQAPEWVQAVRFELPFPMEGRWDRFMDGEHFGKKTYLHYGSKLNGWMWTPPDQRLDKGDTLYVTEGIFDALAIMHSGRKVAALMGATNKPQAFLNEYNPLRINYVIALDNDKAGQDNSIKLVRFFRENGEQVSCIQPAADAKKKIDWNDLLLAGKLTDHQFDEYQYYGDLLTAVTPTDRANLMYSRNGESFFVFEHQNQTYVWELDIEKYDKAINEIREAESAEDDSPVTNEQRTKALARCNAVSHLANCGLDFLYTQRNPVTDELFYFFRIRHPDGRETLNTFTGAQLAAAADFRKRLLSAASGGLMRASQEAHNWLLTRWMGNIRDVDVVGYAGYSAAHDAWIYPKFAVNKGKVIEVNSEDYIEISTRCRVKSAYHNVDISANRNLTEFNQEWFHDFYTAWGSKGVIALAFWTLSLFAQQVREINKSLTFLELVGDPGTGKTTLIEFIWKLFGRENFEGFDPSSSNPAYIARTLNQTANMPVVMIEGDRGQRSAGHRGKFDWSETKKLYNGRSMKGRGMRTQGNETYEPPFLGSLCISQNSPVDAEQAVLERIVHVFFRKQDTNSNTLVAVKRLTRLQIEDLSGYLIKCLTQADKLLNTYKQWQPIYEDKYRNQDGQKTYRLALNHSQIAAALHMLNDVIPIQDSTIRNCLTEVERMSLLREKAIAREHPDVEQFMEVIEYLEQQGGKINHNGADGQDWAINLNEVYEQAAKYQQQLQQQVLIKPLLQSSRLFIDCKAIHSKISAKTVRCWLLKRREL